MGCVCVPPPPLGRRAHAIRERLRARRRRMKERQVNYLIDVSKWEKKSEKNCFLATEGIEREREREHNNNCNKYNDKCFNAGSLLSVLLLFRVMMMMGRHEGR